MIGLMVGVMLGSYGRSVLSYYEAHRVPLDAIILTYGLIMLVSWQNMLAMYRFMVVDVAKQIHLHPDLNGKSSVKKVAAAISVPWQEAARKARFPLVASQIALVPVPKSAAAIQRVVNSDQVIEHALALLNGADPRKIRPSYKMMWTREVAKKNAKS